MPSSNSDVEDTMMCRELWIDSVPRAELDDRARDSRRRCEQLQRLLVPAPTSAARLRRRRGKEMRGTRARAPGAAPSPVRSSGFRL
jgi:hypothetical protein